MNQRKQNHTSSVGYIGESIACGYLERNRYKIVSRNFRTRFGEIDIISKSPHKILTFVEVKTISTSETPLENTGKSYPHFSTDISSDFRTFIPQSEKSSFLLTPEDNFHFRKFQKFQKISQWYANEFPDISKKGYSLDLVCIELNAPSKTYSLRHYKNVSL